MTQPLTMYGNRGIGLQGANSMFSILTSFTYQRCLDGGVIGGQSCAELMRAWTEKYRIQAPRNDDNEVVARTAILLPIPHALLCAGGFWKSWAFPVLLGRRAGGQRSGLVKKLWAHITQETLASAAAGRSAMFKDSFGADDLLSVAETFQQCLQLQSCDGELRELVKHHLGWLLNMRANLQSRQMGVTKKAYDLDVLIKSVVASGLLTQASHLRTIFELAIDVSVGDPPLRDHLKQLLGCQGALPGQATLYRHRLTLHMGLCSIAQDFNKSLVGSRGGLVSWRTLDLSPQGGVEWLLQRTSCMKQSSLARAFDLSLMLYLDDESAESQAAVADELKKLLVTLPAVPLGVGSGRKSVKYRAHAVTHGQRLTSPSWSAAAMTLNSTVSLTGDLGEAPTVKFKGDIRTMFGNWAVESDSTPGAEEQAEPEFDFDLEEAMRDGSDEEGCGDPVFEFDAAEDADPERAQEEQPEQNDGSATPRAEQSGSDDDPDIAGEDDPYTVNFRRAIFIGGPHHVLHNFTEGLDKVLVWWPTFILLLKHVCRLLSNKWSCDRLVRSCFLQGPARIFADSVVRFNARVFDKRWGTAWNATHRLLPLMPGLHVAWSLARYLGHHGVQEAANDDDRTKDANIDHANEALTSTLFLGYLLMIDICAVLFLLLSAWFDACPCHYNIPGSEAFCAAERRSYWTKKQADPCVMAGRRAPEWAAGAFFDFLSTMCGYSANTLLFELASAGLTDQEKSTVMQDVGALRRQLFFVLQVKFCHWQQLPWILSGLAHEVKEVAMRCAVRALQLFAGASDQDTHHMYTLALLLPGRGLTEMEALAQGISDITDLGLLWRMAARFRFVITTDRWVEALHAESHHWLATAPNAGPVHVAFHAGLPTIMPFLRDHPTSFSEYAAHCKRTRNPHQCLQRMGLYTHPTVRRLIEEKGIQNINRRSAKHVVALLYHVDAETLYSELPDSLPEDVPPPPPGPPPPAAPASPPRDDGDDPPGPPPPPASGSPPPSSGGPGSGGGDHHSDPSGPLHM